MTGEGIRPIAALAAAVLATGVLAACGDSGSGTTSSGSNGTPATRPASKPGTEAGSNGSGDNASQANPKKNNGSGRSPSNVETAPLKVSGGGSSQYRVKGGDNSIQDFGEESGESELEEAATALHDFLVARAKEDWPAACSRLTETVVQQLKQLASRSDKFSGAGCARILAALTPALPAKVHSESTVVDAGSLRSEGEQAFLIYRGAEGAVYAIPMAPQGGAWKVGALAATPLQ